MGPPGERSTGRPSPPPTPGRPFSPDRGRAPEGTAPATRREPERSTAGRRPEREQGGRGATPPPPPPHQPASGGGPGPHPPRQGGWTPPAREGSRSVTRPPAPAAGSNGGREEQVGPRLRTATPRRSCPEKPGGREPEWYGSPPPHGQHDASDARFVACPGKAARHLPREGVRRQQARGETCCPAAR